jgi:hypothetical protein
MAEVLIMSMAIGNGLAVTIVGPCGYNADNEFREF